MTEILGIFKAYNGTGYYSILFIAALLYLWFTEEDRQLRALIVISPAVIQVLFFVPYFYMGYNMLDEGTYYRILWLLPMTLVIAYAACKVIGTYTRAGLAIMSLILVISGTCVYTSVLCQRAENIYHIPEEVVEVCDMIKPEEGRERVWASFPISMIQYVRQYTTTIQMPYGRDSIVPTWDYVENPVYEIYRQKVINAEELTKRTSEAYCNYIILDKAQVLDGELEECGVVLIGETSNYDVYRNTNVDFWD